LTNASVPAGRHWRATVLGLAAGLACVAGVASATPARFVIGTSQGDDTVAGRLQRRIYVEAFRRMDVPLEIAVFPLQRLSISTDEGSIDGDVARVQGYGASHPQLVRVEEPVYEVTWALFALNPALEALPELGALSATRWRGSYLRGVGVCERALKALLPPERLQDVTSDAQGFTMMRLGRTEVHCTADLSALTLQTQPEFRDVVITRRVVDIGTFPLYPYVHKRNAELAPRLAATLRQMKAEGLVDRYRAEVLRDNERR